MSNANKGIAGWMKNNPGMTMGIVLFIVMLIAIIGWMMNKTKDDIQIMGPGAQNIVKPTIKFGPTEKILYPNPVPVETYMIEYAAAPGTAGTSSAKYIDIIINWSNGAGFTENDIKSIKFVRKSGTTTIDTIDTKDLENPESYVKNFETGLSIKFPGSILLDNYKGTDGNIPISIDIFTVDDEGNEGNIATKTETISQSDLDTTLTISSIVKIQASPVLSESFSPIKDTGGRSTKYIFLFGHDSTVIPELSAVTLRVRDDGWVELYNASGKQVNITNAPDVAQTYNFEKFGDNDLYLIKGRFNNAGDGGYLLYNKKTDGTVTGWEFAGSTLSAGLENILKDETRYKRAFVKIQEFNASPAGPSRPYPPKPYPGAVDSSTVRRNSYSWTVAGSDYGNGQYTMSVSDSYMDASNTGVTNDAEGIFDEGENAIVGHTGTYTGGPLGEYFARGGTDGKVYWFDFILPVKIRLQKMRVFPRSVSAEEAAQMASDWTLYGIDTSLENSHVLLNKSTDVTFNTSTPTDIAVNQNIGKKFKQFKAVFNAKPNAWTIIQEIIFMGSDEEAIPT